jgi:catechol 2,3-dioxygenase-like lactoylglutathione lyase family enzyme
VYETVVYGRDVESVVSFYVDLLGVPRVSDIGDYGAALRLDTGLLLVFDPDRSAAAGRAVPSHGTAGPGHVAFAIENGEYDRWLAFFRERGVEIEREVAWGDRGRSIYVRDPAGNSVELVEGEVWPP